MEFKNFHLPTGIIETTHLSLIAYRREDVCLYFLKRTYP